MSNIYIQEPPTNGKVLLKTSVGELEIELWSKECPKACRNFIQLVLDGFYNGTIFHRLVKGFIVQGGENSEPADCIEPIKNEFHSRLRFTRRGLVGMANNTEDNDSNMQFFFTLDATPELEKTHTLFGKITGETIYNMIKLGDGIVDPNERPVYPHKIIKAKILNNPFPDILPRVDRKISKDDSKDSKKARREGVKNFKLISFGDEAEEDEMEIQKFPKEREEIVKTVKPPVAASSSSQKESEPKKERKSRFDKEPASPPSPKKVSKPKEVKEASDSDSDYESTVVKEKRMELEKKKKEIQDQIKDVKKQYHQEKKDRNNKELEEEVVEEPKVQEDDTIQDYLDEKERYKSKKLPSKGKTRESQTLLMLEKFKNRLHSVQETNPGTTKDAGEHDSDDENWLSHKLDFSESEAAVLAKDASTKQEDWYDIYDPRNPLNKRKRNEKPNTGESSKKRR
ncbi:unnamed protein product [Diamesa serratosioi]